MTDTRTAVQKMIDHVKAGCTPIDREQRFRDMLNEVYSFDCVGGPFAYMDPAKVLEEMDPTAFRCGVNDYIDGEDTYEIDGETYDVSDVDEARQEFIDELQTEIDDLESELEDEEEPDRTEVDALIDDLAECEAHSF